MTLDAIDILTQLSVLLLLGILGSALARKLKISNMLVLLVMGFIIGTTVGHLFELEEVFLVAVAVLTLAIVVFQGTSRLSYRQLDNYSVPALKLTVWQLMLVSVIVGATSYALFFSSTPEGLILSLILAVSLAGTDPSSIFLMVKEGSQRVVQLLTFEAVVNTPIMVVIPFILIDTLDAAFTASHLKDILLQVVVGIGAGVIVGLVVFKTMRKVYADNISTVAVIAAALLTYILAENLEGSGVLAVATLGLLFGNFSIKKKEELQAFSFEFSSVLETLIFLLIGIIIGPIFPLEPIFIATTLALFLALLLARILAITLVMWRDYDWRSMLFCSLTMPKGIAVAVLIFTFALVPQVPQQILSILFAITLYSILLATFAGLWWNSRLSAQAQAAAKKGAKKRGK